MKKLSEKTINPKKSPTEFFKANQPGSTVHSFRTTINQPSFAAQVSTPAFKKNHHSPGFQPRAGFPDSPSSLSLLYLFIKTFIKPLTAFITLFFIFATLIVVISPKAFATQSKTQALFPKTTQTSPLPSPSPQKKVALALRVNLHPPIINGRLDDPTWEHGDWYTDFIQFHPYEGQAPTEQTAFKILYDEKNLYIAVRCYDSKPETIERRLGRRDNLSGDYVMIFIDSLHDLRTSFCFGINAAGVKADQLLSNDSFDYNKADLSWDPIWEAKAAVDEKGWTAEIKIPFSQLRFTTKGEQIWGLQIWRELFRNGETSLWQPIPRKAPGWTSQFGELRGMTGLKPPRQIELMPYAVGKLRSYPSEPGNPFLTGRQKSLFGGLDGKIGLTHDLTLNFTLNPDFGQVEADPSEINLTAYETYFEEKRPFFVENQNITNFKITGGDGDFSYDNLLYSRRIGRAPQIYPATSGYYSIPTSTNILGAFKLSGKTRNGWSIGAMEAITSRETASTFDPGTGIYGRELVEPLTNYFAFRLSKDYRQGATVVGTMFTAVNRDLEGRAEEVLHRSAYSSGFDLYHSWANRQYYFSLKLVGSAVFGSEEAIQRTQLSSVHYFNRPDARHLTFDPTRRYLYGHGGSIDFGRIGGSRLMFSTGATWRSPGLELNDIGFLRYADVVMQYFWIGYRFFKPFSLFRSLNLNFNQWSGWNFGGERIFAGGNVNTWAQFKNYWTLSFGINRQFTALSQSALRGGPLLRVAPATNYWSYLQTDGRKKLRLALQSQWRRADKNDSFSLSLGPQITYVPTPSFNLSLRPSYSIFRSELQYVGKVNYAAEKRYLVGKINQKTASMVVRLNLSLTPDLTVQFYGMPFISAGKYSRFKMITQPRAKEWTERYHLFGDDQINYNEWAGIYKVDEDRDGQIDYSFRNPDFNFLQFRSNLVLRWEYKPGCTLFLVWSQGRTDYGYSGLLDFGSDITSLFKTKPDNVFLLKFSYNFDL
jgi:hypothetical protein